MRVEQFLAEVGRSGRINTFTTTTTFSQYGAVNDARGRDARNLSYFFEHALLYREELLFLVARHGEIRSRQHHTLRLKTERRVNGALHAAESHQRSGYEQCAEGDLDRKQYISQRQPAERHFCGDDALHHLPCVGPADLPCRQYAKQDTAP